MTTSGYQVDATVTDLSMVMSFATNVTLNADDTVYYYSILVTEQNGSVATLTASVEKATKWFFDHIYEGCSSSYVCGDADNNGTHNVADPVYTINHIFKGGPAPVNQDAADANCDGSYNISDAVHSINFIFKGGPPPCCPT
jgi:hypothetical protein